MTNPIRRPIATRAQAYRVLRPHLVPLGAMALAADRGAAQLTAAMLRNSEQARYVPKIRGLLVAVAWGEGVREWVTCTKPPNVRLHTPYDWTELLIGELHVRLQRDTNRAPNARRQSRRQQLPDPTLPFAITLDGAFIPDEVTNIDVNAILTGEGRIRGVQAVAPLGKGFAWASIDVKHEDMVRQLTSWERREVPWLTTIRQFATLANGDNIVVRLLDQMRDMQELIENLQQQLADQSAPDRTMATPDFGPAAFGNDDSGLRPPRFSTPPKPAENEASGDKDR